MENLLNSYDKEYMKMAMLKHEETFREQVYELHRLYGIQKLLMKKTKNGKQVQEQSRWNLGNSKSSDLVNNPHAMHKRLRPAEEYVEDESELELTLGPTSQCRRKKILDTSDSAASFSSSSSTVSSRIKSSNSGSDQRISTPRENLSARNWSLQMPPSSKPLFITERRDGSEVEEEFRRDRHSNPSWLFQSLTLNTSSKNHLQSV